MAENLLPFGEKLLVKAGLLYEIPGRFGRLGRSVGHGYHGERYPLDEDFLAALAHMPAASGCALGFERLVMLAAGATAIDQVIWTPLAGESK